MCARTHPLLLATPVALSLAACASPEPADDFTCTSNLLFALAVDVHDSATGASLHGARGAVHDGTYVDSLRGPAAPDDTTFEAAGERAGTYTVELVRPGYQPFSRAGVVVTRDECHVHAQLVRAAMVPSR